ncbi:MAG: response regulator [Prochloraceae cyanobacterium]|nr:response regulator [Prochloraceae cyanobacterium]
MADDRERAVRLKFLEEAQEYLDNIETQLLGIGAGNVDRQRIDSVLRGAHSIKGGAGMMGFEVLSDLAHRMEDFFKVIKVAKEQVADENIERLLLSGVDRLRQVIDFNRQGASVPQECLEGNINPVFDRLHEILGDPQPEDTATLLSEEEGEDMVALLFETEVEACLERLQSVLDHPEKPCLSEEFAIAAEELGGLGEMLELPAFTNLCQDILTHLKGEPEKTEEIAIVALQELRRARAMVLVGQAEAIPDQLNFNLQVEEIAPVETKQEPIEVVLPLEEISQTADYAWTTQDFQEAEEFLSSLKEVSSEEKSEDLAIVPEVTSQPERPAAAIAENSKAASVGNKTLRVSLDKLDRLGDLFGELIVERNSLALQLSRMRTFIQLLSKRVKNLEESNFRLRGAYDRVATTVAMSPQPPTNRAINEQVEGLSENLANVKNFNSQFDLLEMDRYSDIHLLSREVIDTIVQLQEVTTDIEITLDDTDRTSRNLNRTSKLLSKSFTDVRMRPFSDLVEAFPRALRDMSLEYKKKASLKLKGEYTLIDREALDSLREPLMHLFRNAFAHGIEEPSRRIAAGKPEIGTIEISATQRSDQILIKVKDDGGGIDINKIRAKAIKMGFNPQDLQAVNDRELLKLIFEPGFTTATQVTDISGRGVGMDIVRLNIRKIQGDIYVDTKLGVGTTFTIVVPFNLSIARVLVVESAGMLMAFPSNAVEEMLVPQPDMLMKAAGKEVLNWEGEMIPLIRLNSWLNYPRPYSRDIRESAPAIDCPVVLIIARGENFVAIEFDRYWEEQEVTLRQVEGNIKMPSGFNSCTILGDGIVVPLVEAISLLDWIDECSENEISLLSQQIARANSQNTAQYALSPEENKTIMIVDDSINIRRFLTLILEKAGYQVEQAKDGQDAIEKLQAIPLVKAIICDIEMPVLDGFGFLANVKKSDSNSKDIPVVMLTSRSGEKHRQLAMNLGATAYFSKPFREPELLKTLDRLISSSNN